tara:strand:- start:306 stop:527 length:222 start_codon:yes stop_codon:yes gene_type:complete
MHKIGIRQPAVGALPVLQKQYPIVCRESGGDYGSLSQSQSRQKQTPTQGSHGDPFTGRVVSALAGSVESDWAG